MFALFCSVTSAIVEKYSRKGREENQDESNANWRLKSLSHLPLSFSVWLSVLFLSTGLHVRRVCVCTVCVYIYVCVCSVCSTATFDDTTLTDESYDETPLNGETKGRNESQSEEEDEKEMPSGGKMKVNH